MLFETVWRVGGMLVALTLGCTAFAEPSARLTKTTPVTLGGSPFSVATAKELRAAGIPEKFIERRRGQPITVTFEKHPLRRWSLSQGSYPDFVARVLEALGDTNAVYVGDGEIQISSGPRRVLIAALVHFRDELAKQGLALRIVKLARDDEQNARVRGDANSDHLIGFAADVVVTVAACSSNDIVCSVRAAILEKSPLEQRLRILMAVHAVGIQQLNIYPPDAKERKGLGVSLHLGMSPFRNGAQGEKVGNVDATGVRRVGYSGPQKGKLGALTKLAAKYVSPDGIAMKDVFERVLRNDPPEQYRSIFDAVRSGDIDRLRALAKL